MLAARKFSGWRRSSPCRVFANANSPEAQLQNSTDEQNEKHLPLSHTKKEGICRHMNDVSLNPVFNREHYVAGERLDFFNMVHHRYSTQSYPSHGLNKVLGNMPEFVRIVEVGPRDGLQNEKKIVPTSSKVELIKLLVSAGLSVVEATSFVSPKWVPQLADAKDVIQAIKRIKGVRFPVLTPNLKGFEAAISSGAKEVAVFAAASESFSRSNINCSIEESLARYRDIALAAKNHSIPVRGYISCVVGCPVEGAVHPSRVAYVAKELLDMGCFEISLGDTIGVGTPGTVIPMLEAVCEVVPVEKLAVHFHDTYGQALEVRTNVDIHKLMLAGEFICRHLGRPLGSKTAIALAKGPPPPTSKL